MKFDLQRIHIPNLSTHRAVKNTIFNEVVRIAINGPIYQIKRDIERVLGF